jgi:hypothetical protein
MNPQRENLPLDVRFGKWAGLFCGSMGWGLEQQILSTTAFTACPPGANVLATTVAVVCAVIAIAGGLWSWRALRSLPESAPQSDVRLHSDRFIAVMSMMMAVFGVLAIAFGTPAGWIVRCGH